MIPADTQIPSPAPRDTEQRFERPAALAILVALVLVLAALTANRIAHPFGDSDEGINGAVWALDARSLGELGVVDSTFGGTRIDGTRYASHPPMIVAVTAGAQTVAGEGGWADRFAAWGATLAAVALLYLLARDLALRPVPAAATVVATMACHMVTTYGFMLDTPVTSLPFGIAVALLWARAWRGITVPAAMAGAIALGASLSGWQAALIAGMAGVTLVVSGARSTRHAVASWKAGVPWLIGTALGGALSMGWALWTYGSIDEMVRKLTQRSGGDGGGGLVDLVSFQLPWMTQLLGAGVLALVVCGISLRSARFRPVAALSLTAVLGYALLFREAAGGHQYWMYWSLLPVAIGWAYVFGPGADRMALDLRTGTRGVALAITAVALVVGAINLTRPDQAGELIDRGNETVALVTATTLPDGQVELPYVGQAERPDSWVVYSTDLDPRQLVDADALRRLADTAPDHRVLVLGRCDEPTAELCRSLGLPVFEGPGGLVAPEMVTAAELAQRLDGG